MGRAIMVHKIFIQLFLIPSISWHTSNCTDNQHCYSVLMLKTVFLFPWLHKLEVYLSGPSTHSKSSMKSKDESRKRVKAKAKKSLFHYLQNSKKKKKQPTTVSASSIPQLYCDWYVHGHLSFWICTNSKVFLICLHECIFNFVLCPPIKNMTFHSHSDCSGYSGFRDPALLNSSVPTNARTLWRGSSTSSFASTGSAMLSTTSASLRKLALVHAMPNLLPGNPNSKELEIGLDKTLFVISAKSSWTAGKIGSGISSQESVLHIPTGNEKVTPQHLLRAEWRALLRIAKLHLPFRWQSSSNSDSCCTGWQMRQYTEKVAQNEETGWKP